MAKKHKVEKNNVIATWLIAFFVAYTMTLQTIGAYKHGYFNEIINLLIEITS